ncbi:hypothetical protein EIP91_010419 [Steccherinum ochraceum]|uniref:Uncharacterized protein n=1 Tax=Steccherinum ochraceum TaxID=92696 RepID=A0A4R0R9R7_9APHY|nr:hypothetical protein EIP91_010419 [Steccherinum ochraceum]
MSTSSRKLQDVASNLALQVAHLVHGAITTFSKYFAMLPTSISPVAMVVLLFIKIIVVNYTLSAKLRQPVLKIDSEDGRDFKVVARGVYKARAGSLESCMQLWEKLWYGKGGSFTQDSDVDVPGILGPNFAEPCTRVTASFLDLSFLERDSVVMGVLNVPFLVETATRMSRKEQRSYSGGSGYGKTIALLNLLVAFLQEGTPCILQYTQDEAWCFSAKGVHQLRLGLLKQARDTRNVLKALKFPSKIFVLVDCNNNVQKPHPHFTFPGSGFFIVTAASPRPDRSKEWHKYSNAAVIFLPPPDWQEFCAAGVHSHQLDSRLLARSYSIIGPDARRGFSAARDEQQFATFIADMKTAARELACDTTGNAQLLNLFDEANPIDPSFGHNGILSIRPDPSNPSVAVGSLGSPYGRRLYCQQLELNVATRIAEQYKLFAVNPKQAALAGHIYEASAHNHLPGTPRTLSVLPKRDRIQITVAFPDDPTDINFPGDLLPTSQTSAYLIPSSASHPTFDAFFFLEDHVYILQMTISRTHALKATGLDHLADAIAQERPALLPTVARPWHFVWIVPGAVAPDLNKKRVVGNSPRNWKVLLRQYTSAYDIE